MTTEDTKQEVQETQVKPAAGIWLCNNCGRRIQVITESDVEKKQSFICVCGAEMEPGEEHTQVLDDKGRGDAVDA